MNINNLLKEYIEKNILSEYDLNDLAHGLSHINYVINRSLKFAQTVPNINFDMVYTIASFHDVGYKIDAKNHEKVSSQILMNDEYIKKFFSKQQIQIMADAISDHRASKEGEPRSIYGKIVSSQIGIPLLRLY